jgi:hypothetical protein
MFEVLRVDTMNFIYLTINYAVHTICRGGGGAPPLKLEKI